MTTPLLDAVQASPAQAGLLLGGILLAVAGAAVGLRHLDRRQRSLRRQLLAVTMAALGVGAASTVALARLMVLDAQSTRIVVTVLTVTALLAVALVFAASAPLANDVRTLERAVRRVEHGDRTVRTGVSRTDELGHVARAFDDLVGQLARLEGERAGFEAERAQLLSSVGHDLRTPLAALQAALEAIEDGVALDRDRYMRSMLADVGALRSLVDDLFLLSRVDAGLIDLTAEALDLAELADEAIEALAPVAAARSVTLQVAAAGAVPVLGNATALGRVIRNLLDNAIRHAPDGSTVTVRVDGEGEPKVVVHDEGPGFPAGFAERAFDRFTRADAARGRATGGTGLGLAIARGVVEAHGGRIWIDAAARGARVAFALPAP
ncbi:MAG: HAMP domain-containing sensor histidine kinase [Acidimicrobiales bacterium]